MIKIYNIREETMDIIMSVVRDTGCKPDYVVKVMLGVVGLNEAKLAVIHEQEKERIN